MESDLQMWKLQHTKEDKTDLNCKLGGNPRKSLTLNPALVLLLLQDINNISGCLALLLTFHWIPLF